MVCFDQIGPQEYNANLVTLMGPPSNPQLAHTIFALTEALEVNSHQQLLPVAFKVIALEIGSSAYTSLYIYHKQSLCDAIGCKVTPDEPVKTLHHTCMHPIIKALRFVDSSRCIQVHEFLCSCKQLPIKKAYHCNYLVSWALSFLFM